MALIKTRAQFVDRQHMELGIKTPVVWIDMWINTSQVAGVVQLENDLEEDGSDCQVWLNGTEILIEMPCAKFIQYMRQ
jgi:hypothetical protein